MLTFRLAIIVLTVFSVCPFFVTAEEKHEVDAELLRCATRLLQEKHLRRKVDRRQLSTRWARQYMRSLDPHRMHFLDSDAVEFAKSSGRLLPDAGKGDVSFAMQVAKRFKSRLEANSTLINRLLSVTPDFSLDESMPLEYATYASTQAACDERWRRRIKYEFLLEKSITQLGKRKIDGFCGPDTIAYQVTSLRSTNQT